MRDLMGESASWSSKWVVSDWWSDVNESTQWQDGVFFFLCASYALVSAVALIQLIRIQLRVPEFGWTTQKIFHLMNFIVNGVRAIVFGFHAQVFLFRPKVFTLVLLDLPGLLFFSTYTLLVLFWAEIYHQARSLPTDKLRKGYIITNCVIYVIQVCIWIYLWIDDNNIADIIGKVFITVVSFIAALGFLIYGGRLFSMLRRFPIESKGRRKKLHEVAGSSASSSSGCFLSSHEYLTASYFNNHDSLHDSDFHDFLNQKIGSNGSCKRPVDNNVVGVSDLRRILIGEGSHRHLVSTVKFDMQSDAWSSVDDHSCEAIIIERLPVGVFADPFELQHLVERRVLFRAAVFGDTNLELPSTLSNRSIVEIHMVIRNNTASKSSETVVQLPLHARYPPLNPSGYARVVIGNPDLFLRCRPKDLKYQTYSWSVTNLRSESNSVTWRVPCGNEELTGIVSRITFISALFCSLLLVSSAIYFSRNDHIEVS